MGLLATIGEWLLSWSGPQGWRQRREQWYTKAKPTYDAYPSVDVPPPMKFYVEARDRKGRLLREYVDLEGYSLHQLNWRFGAMRGRVLVRDWFVEQMLEAMVRLSNRLDEVKERHEFRYPEETQ